MGVLGCGRVQVCGGDERGERESCVGCGIVETGEEMVVSW